MSQCFHILKMMIAIHKYLKIESFILSMKTQPTEIDFTIKYVNHKRK